LRITPAGYTARIVHRTRSVATNSGRDGWGRSSLDLVGGATLNIIEVASNSLPPSQQNFLGACGK
jgi:hypothetical protein